MNIIQGIYIIALFCCTANAQPEFDIDEFDDLYDSSEMRRTLKRPMHHDSSRKKHHLPENSLPECGECSCPQTPQCETGVSLVEDGCGCCKVCAKQLNDRCDAKNVCDHHKGLFCDENTGTCKAQPGRSCHVANKWYENGALFSPNCRLSCYCTDGDVACKSKCRPGPPPGCRYPKKVRSSSKCCWQWKCSTRPTSQLARGSKSAVSVRGSCVIQSTDWSPCSATCGFGSSERITNDNDQCKLKTEQRLCIVRACKGDNGPRKSKRSCRKHVRRGKRIQYSFSGCVSTKTYRPKYCGTCRHSDKCCRPHSTKTIDMEFRCEQPDGSFQKMTKKMMMIQSCECGNFCSTSENDIFSHSSRSLHNDIYRSR